MSVNFNGGLPKSVQGFGGVKPNVNPTFNNENVAVNGGELNVNPDKTQGTTTMKTIVITKDDNGYHCHIEDGNPREVILPNGDIIVFGRDGGGTLNGVDATEGEIWHALMVGLGYFD